MSQAALDTSSSWADAENDLPATQVTENPDGTKTIVSYKINDQGKKVKVTQKVRLVTVKETVDPAIAARRKWSRFGEEKENRTVGPDNKTTQFGEEVQLILGTSWKEDAQKEAEARKKEMAQKKPQTIICRTCQGDHFTSKCPYKDTLGATDATSATTEQPATATPDPLSSTAPGPGGVRYVPPHLRRRGGAPAPGESERKERDDSTTLRVTSLNEQVDDIMLREVFNRYGIIKRATVLRDRETRRSKGIAFVEFDNVLDAQRALEGLNGRGFMNLIMKVDWSKPKKN
ncbi:hypothetical protein OGAPHI_002631 [Ogataea philodendri]|uniref:Eukaryotic translation initiation factor 3 subunit G n=1 Tax=Ogataea philodendri TaxID=1378263 RepID=A0A9P8PBS6_9ASCO|nr:uncharacterized protein OGAPHI_002631 [Ogataea philodendri]KAH3668876.1 hypothetical protein OGAPHI_002631 [Ogataea philodendri]